MRFTSDYMIDGTGLHYYQDPEDKEEYLYTQYEAFYAHKVFPCFDQPDLKATLEVMLFAD
jgi:aminopeptidase N